MDVRPGNADTDPMWSKLLSLSAHEFRSPLTAVAGYLRMLLQGRAGPVSDQQRRLLEEAEKSCGRLSHVLAELSELSQLEAGTAPFTRSTVNLTSILAAGIAALPELRDRAVTVSLEADGTVSVPGDAVRLKTACAAILHALRRELVTSDELVVRVEARADAGGPSVRIAIGERHRIEPLLQLDPASMAVFDEWRGGNGLGLPNARRIIEAHGGRVRSAHAGGAESKTSAVIVLPSVG